MARQAGVHASQLYGWRRQLRAQQPMSFAPVRIAEGSGRCRCRRSQTIEIEFASGARMRIAGAADPATLTAGGVWIATGHTDMRRGMNALALLVQGAAARSTRRRPLRVPRQERQADQDSLARWSRHVALCQASGARKVHLARGIGRRRVDLDGADGLYARRDRMEESATDLAAAERGLSG